MQGLSIWAGLMCLLCAAATPGYGATYNVTRIPLPEGSTGIRIVGINAAGQVAGTVSNGSQITANFLYTPGAGATNIERTGPVDPAGYEGSGVAAINSTGQVLLHSGALYTYRRAAPQQLAPAILAAFPAESLISFIGLNDRGQTSGIAETNTTDLQAPFNQNVFLYAPGGSVTLVAHTTNRRSFPAGPFKLDDAGDVVYTPGSPPGGAILFLADGATILTHCGFGNGEATAITNSSLIGGFWQYGPVTAGDSFSTPAFCSFFGPTTFLTPRDIYRGGELTALNDFGDGVGYASTFSNMPTYALFSQGQVIALDSLFPAGSGWVTTSVTAINDAGQIAGTGTLNGVPSAFVLSPAPVSSYTLQPICPDFPCTGISLSQSGSVAAQKSASDFIIYTPGQNLATVGNVLAVTQINASGVIAGTDITHNAFVSAPPYTTLEYLDAVCAWTNGVALGLNDGDDVIGTGNAACPGSPLAGLNGLRLYQINNANQIIGSYVDNFQSAVNFIYRPDSGITPLPMPPVALSNSGHVLMGSAASGYSVLLPDGEISLPSGYIWRGLNDLDQVVGDDQSGSLNAASYYSAATGVVKLASLVTGVSGYNLRSATAINDAGEILVDVELPNQTAPAAALLVPGASFAASLTAPASTRGSGDGEPNTVHRVVPISRVRSVNR